MERNADKNVVYERYRLICSYVASVLLHCAFLALVYYSSTSYPIVAMSSTNDVLWFYPSLLFGSPSASDEGADQGVSSPPMPAARVSEQRSIPAAPDPAADDSGHDEAPVRLADMPPGSTLMKPVEKETPAEFSAVPVPALPPSKTSAKPEKPVHKTLKTVAASPKSSETRDKPPVKRAERPPVIKPRSMEPLLTAKPAMADTGAGIRAAGPRFSAVSSGKAAHGGGAEVKNETKTGAAGKIPAETATAATKGATAGTPKGTTAAATTTAATGAVAAPPGAGKAAKAQFVSPAQGVPPVSGGGGESKQVGAPVAAKEPLRPSSPVTAKAAEQKASGAAAKAKGLFLPPLIGDIKFELIAREDVSRGVQVAVGFRDFPKSKRGKPLSRSEAGRVRTLHPKIVMPKENTIHAVIDRAAAGVYYLRIELQRDRVSDVSIKIRLFEGSSRAKNTTVHIRSITGNETVVRLMMPEGIVWEDPSAFSGSLEDSDSETKFNADMGVEWKEYK